MATDQCDETKKVKKGSPRVISTWVTNTMEPMNINKHDANVNSDLCGRSRGYSSMMADIMASSWTNLSIPAGIWSNFFRISMENIQKIQKNMFSEKNFQKKKCLKKLLKTCYLAIESQEKQHQKENNRPKLREWQHSDRLRVRDKS